MSSKSPYNNIMVNNFPIFEFFLNMKMFNLKKEKVPLKKVKD
jgi:hypothetical protein